MIRIAKPTGLQRPDQWLRGFGEGQPHLTLRVKAPEQWQGRSGASNNGLPAALERQSHTHLPGSTAAQFRAARAGDATKRRTGDIQLRVIQVDVIGDVGE